jgi:single-strand DNA-binding protein
MNIVILKGNLSRDPETRFLPTGSAVTEFGIAVNKQWKDRDTGEKREEVYFAECVMWGARGEAFAKFHKKGDQALIHGELKNDSWEDKETGKKMSKTRINVNEFDFVGGRREQSDDPRTTRTMSQRPAPRPAPRQAETDGDNTFDGDSSEILF